MKILVYNTKGDAEGNWELDAKALGKQNSTLLAQAIRVYESNSHQKTSRVKTRGEVTGSTRKIYRQKGTGRARHGARYAPLFVGGGIAHGPKGVKPGNLVLPQKMRRAALASAILLKLEGGKVVGLTGVSQADGKTSTSASLLSALAGHPKSKVLVVTNGKTNALYKGMGNLQNVRLARASLVNAYDLVSVDYCLVTKKALDTITTRVGSTK